MKKIKTQLIGAGVLVSVLFFLTGCPYESKPSTPPKQYTVKFEAGADGTLTAKTGGGDSISSGEQIYEGTKIIFTATPSTAGDGYYILGWTGKGLKVSPDKQTAELTVKNNTEIKVKFLEHRFENVNWYAEGQLEDTNGNKKDFRLLINDGGKYFSFFDKVAGTSVFANMDYDENSKAVQLLNPLGKGSITFISMPQTLPAEWEISLSGVEIKKAGTSQILKLKDGTVKVKVTVSDNFIH